VPVLRCTGRKRTLQHQLLKVRRLSFRCCSVLSTWPTAHKSSLGIDPWLVGALASKVIYVYSSLSLRSVSPSWLQSFIYMPPGSSFHSSISFKGKLFEFFGWDFQQQQQLLGILCRIHNLHLRPHRLLLLLCGH
jgi:hypothetical protein